MTSPSLRANFAWNLVGNISYAASQWAMLIVLAKLTTTEMTGRFTLGLAFTAPFVMFANLQLRTLQATDSRCEFKFSEYLSLRLITAAGAMFIIAVSVMFLSFSREAKVVILLIGAAKTFESISDIFYGLMQQREHMKPIAISMILKGGISILALIVGIKLSGNLIGGVAAMAASWAFLLFVYDIRQGLRLLSTHHIVRKVIRRRSVFHLAWIGLPLGLVTLLASLNISLPRIVLERYQGESSLGIFAALSYVQAAGSTVIRAFGQAAGPRLAKYFWAGDISGFRRLVFRLIIIAIGIGTLGVVAALTVGRSMLTILYSSEYGEYSSLFLLLMIAALFFYVGTPMFDVITATRQLKVQVLLSAIIALITIGSSMLFVPKLGLIGGALALLLSSGVMMILSTIVVVLTMRKRGRLVCDEKERMKLEIEAKHKC